MPRSRSAPMPNQPAGLSSPDTLRTPVISYLPPKNAPPLVSQPERLRQQKQQAEAADLPLPLPPPAAGDPSRRKGLPAAPPSGDFSPGLPSPIFPSPIFPSPVLPSAHPRPFSPQARNPQISSFPWDGSSPAPVSRGPEVFRPRSPRAGDRKPASGLHQLQGEESRLI